MAKKKSKKKKLKKKAAKKKAAKKLEAKKIESRKESRKKEKEQNPILVATAQPKDQKTKFDDHSSKYNVLDAVKKLKSLKSSDELLAFTNGEQRLTVTNVIPLAMNRLN